MGVATTLLTELTDPKKSTHNYINDGVLAYKNLKQNEKDASLGKRANNDPSEGNFATLHVWGWMHFHWYVQISSARCLKRK